MISKFWGIDGRSRAADIVRERERVVCVTPCDMQRVTSADRRSPRPGVPVSRVPIPRLILCSWVGAVL